VLHLVFLTLLVPAQQAAPASPPSADTVGRAYYHFLQARTLEGDNDISGAIDNYRQAIALLPGAATLRVELARLHERQNQPAAAEREVRAALESEPDHRGAHLLLGRIQASQLEAQPFATADASLLASAIDHLDRGLDGAPVDGETERSWLHLINLYIRQGNTANAVARAERVLDMLPDYPPGLRLLAKAHEAAGHDEDAAKVLSMLASIRPDGVESAIREADRLERTGRWAEAAAYWSQIVAADPGATIYRPRQAAALAASGNLADARAVLRVAARELPRSVRTWYLSALIEGQAGDAAAVEEAVGRIRAIDPSDGRAPLALARARAAQGDERGVIEVLAPRVERPHATDITSGIIVEMATVLRAAYDELDQAGRGIEALEDARRHVPKNEQLLFTLAAAYETNRRYDHAERTFRELIAANGTHAPALNYLGYMLADRGDKLPEALAFIQRALAIDEDNPAYLDSLGWAYYRLGQFEEAREPLERAARALPKVSVINDHLGDLYVQLKRYGDAAAAFERALAGDRDGVDAQLLERKRDRARELAGKS
jgi:tetratricopeptide (TPR) repeat protein